MTYIFYGDTCPPFPDLTYIPGLRHRCDLYKIWLAEDHPQYQHDDKHLFRNNAIVILREEEDFSKLADDSANMLARLATTGMSFSFVVMKYRVHQTQKITFGLVMKMLSSFVCYLMEEIHAKISLWQWVSKSTSFIVCNLCHS